MSNTHRTTGSRVTVAIAIGMLFLSVLAGGTVGGAVADGSPAADRVQSTQTGNVSEEAYVEPAPEPGDAYYEAEAMDGSWISYINPRDEYRSPYLGDGSGKICTTLLNEEGEVVAGETVPNTTVTIPTGESVAWHSSADPITVEYPVTKHYDRPLDADQFGTDPELPQGDGYMDSHCVEFHGLPEDESIEYGEAEVDGEHADRIEVVGYIQNAHEAWDSSIDPLSDAESYEDAGGGWTYQTGGSHGQAVVVLQLNGPVENDSGNEDDTERDRDADDGEDDSDGDENDDGEDDDGNEDDSDGGENDDGEGDGPESGDDSDGEDEAENETGDSDDTADDETNDDMADDETNDDTADDTDGNAADESTEDDDDASGAKTNAREDADEDTPGFGVLVASIAIAVALLGRRITGGG